MASVVMSERHSPIIDHWSEASPEPWPSVPDHVTASGDATMRPLSPAVTLPAMPLVRPRGLEFVILTANGAYGQGPPDQGRGRGTYRISFTNLTTGHGHSFGDEFLELVPNERIRHSDKFDDPTLPGQMQTTVSLKQVSVGTELTVQEGIVDAIPPRLATSAGKSR